MSCLLGSCLHLYVCSYSFYDFSLLPKFLFMLVINSHLLVRIAIVLGRQSAICSRFSIWTLWREPNKLNSLSRTCSKNKRKCPKECEGERTDRTNVAAVEPHKTDGLFLLLKFCSVRKYIVISLKSTAIYKLPMLHKPVL